MISSANPFVVIGTLALLFNASSVRCQEVVVQDLGGIEIRGELKQLDSQGAELESAAGTKSLSAKDLSTIAFSSAPIDGGDLLQIGLTDGSLIRANRFLRSDGAWSLTTVSSPELTTIPKDLVASVQFIDLKNQAAETWKQLLSSEQTSDLLAILRSDDLETLSGAIVDIDQETVRFELDGQLIPAPRAKVAGLVWFRREPPEDRQAIELFTKDGSKVRCQDVSFKSEGTNASFSLISIGGLKLSVPFEQLHHIEYASANRKWLDEVEVMESASLVETSNGVLSEARKKLLAPKFVVDFDGKTALSGHKDLVFAGPGRITFRSPADYSKLVAVVQRNRSANVVAPLTISVKCDDAVVLSQELAGDQIRVELEADIKPNKRCEIEVTSKSQNPYGSNVIFIQPHLLP